MGSVVADVLQARYSQNMQDVSLVVIRRALGSLHVSPDSCQESLWLRFRQREFRRSRTTCRESVSLDYF